MSLKLPTIYPITDTDLSGLSHAEQTARLIAGGATLIQLRDKYATPRAFYREAIDALNIARAHGVKLIINDRVDIAMAISADGVHLGQTDLPVKSARQLLGEDAIIGFSTHNLDQLRRAVELPVDYLALGPIFGTETKKNPDPLVGLSGLAEARSIIGDMPLVAIGGITSATARLTLKTGANSLATISGVAYPGQSIAENLGQLMELASA